MKRSRMIAVLALAVTSQLFAQGRTDYMNVESPQVHPIEVVRVGGHDFVVACNTRNNTVEIFDTRENVVERRVAVIPVGLEPVTVRWNPRLARLYTANFLGDSVSVISLSSPSGAGTLSAIFEKTVPVGDEPLDIAFHLDETGDVPIETLFITHMALDGIDWRTTETLAPIGGNEMVPAEVTIEFDTSDPPDGVPDEFVGLAAKEPYALTVNDGRLFVLALKGGTNSLDALNFDLDYYCDDLADPFVDPVRVGNLGTTGFSMGFDAAGNLYIVGAEALNDTLQDEPAVKQAPTGFVKSMFFMVENPCSDSPSIHARDVNLEVAQLLADVPLVRATQVTAASPSGTQFASAVQMVTRPVNKNKALSMLTDLAVYETGAGALKVFFTAFGNDRVGIVEPDLNLANPNRWKLRRIKIPRPNDNPLAGPNGLAIKRANPGMGVDDPGDRIYVMNHLDASIVTLDPQTETVVAGGGFSLSHDPRPAHLTLGQQFLYDSETSGNGFDSCASCHIHARTDGRAWDLGDPSQAPASIPATLPEGIDDTQFGADKNNMITQSLQGLLNFEVAPGDQFWVTNAPYHWRGDRASFRDFNGAFASLLGGEELGDAQMAQYEEFVNTIHYPPNPKQPRDRVPSGDFGVGLDLNADGSSGAHRGLKLFHTAATVGARSCASGCHVGFEGSDNHLTESGLGANGEPGNPIEVAALRGLFQKEAKRDVDGSSDPVDSAYTGIEGLIHTGFAQNNGSLAGFDPLHEFNLVASINAFNKLFFSAPLCGTIGDFCPDLQALNQFVHEFDWGVGPLVGCAVTVNLELAAALLPDALPAPVSIGCAGACDDPASSIDCMEQQSAQANSGVAVQALIGGGRSGFVYDPRSRTYLDESDAGQEFTRNELLAKIAGSRDRLVFQAVPLGSERRVAAPTGVPTPPVGGSLPSSLTLLPMVPDTFYARVPELTGRWADFDNSGLEGIFMHTVRLLQWGLILDGAAEDGFGLGTALRHDPARRFQVTGDGIDAGASLVLGYFNGPNGPPDPALPLSQGPIQLISFPLYPTGGTDPASGRAIWQTAVELEPLMYYALMLGGPFGPGVASAYTDQKPFGFPMEDPALDKPLPGQFDPVGWNWLYVFVLNPDGQFGDGGWQRLTLAPLPPSPVDPAGAEQPGQDDAMTTHGRRMSMILSPERATSRGAHDPDNP